MRDFKASTLVSAIALAGAVYAAGIQLAPAAERPAGLEPAPAVTAAAVAPAYYSYHGHHYAYRYHGRYYNHRRRNNGVWVYF